jgi:hypothetical protein
LALAQSLFAQLGDSLRASGHRQAQLLFVNDFLVNQGVMMRASGNKNRAPRFFYFRVCPARHRPRLCRVAAVTPGLRRADAERRTVARLPELMPGLVRGPSTSRPALARLRSFEFVAAFVTLELRDAPIQPPRDVGLHRLGGGEHWETLRNYTFL